jgi:F0F1-type ATP synthase assembly protein I
VPQRTPKGGLASLAVGLSASMEFAVPAVGGALLGRYADGRLHIHPWGTAVGIAVGVGMGGYLMIRVVRRALDRLP